MTAAAYPPAPGRCARRTSPANPDLACQSAFRARRAPPRRVGAHPQAQSTSECRLVRVHASGQSRGDLLEQPSVAVRIAKRGERAVAAMLGIETANPEPPKEIGLVCSSMQVAGGVEQLTDLDAMPEEPLRAASMSETIRYSPWAEPGAATVTFLPKITEHLEPGGVNWITRKLSLRRSLRRVSSSDRHRSVGVIDVGNRNDDNLEPRMTTTRASRRSPGLWGLRLHVRCGLAYCSCQARQLEGASFASSGFHQATATSTIASAKACGASCGRLCPTPPGISGAHTCPRISCA